MATLTAHITVTAEDLADKTSPEWVGCRAYFDDAAMDARDYVYSQDLTTKQRSQLLRDITRGYRDYAIAPFHRCTPTEWAQVHQSKLQTLRAWVARYNKDNANA